MSKSRKSVLLGVWAAPGAPETPQKVGGRDFPPNEMAFEAPRAAQTTKMADFPPLENPKFPPKVQPRNGLHGACKWLEPRSVQTRRPIPACVLRLHKRQRACNYAKSRPQTYPRNGAAHETNNASSLQSCSRNVRGRAFHIRCGSGCAPSLNNALLRFLPG